MSFRPHCSSKKTNPSTETMNVLRQAHGKQKAQKGVNYALYRSRGVSQQQNKLKTRLLSCLIWNSNWHPTRSYQCGSANWYQSLPGLVPDDNLRREVWGGSSPPHHTAGLRDMFGLFEGFILDEKTILYTVVCSF